MECGLGGRRGGWGWMWVQKSVAPVLPAIGGGQRLRMRGRSAGAVRLSRFVDVSCGRAEPAGGSAVRPNYGADENVGC